LDIKGNRQQEKRCGTLEITAMPKRGDMLKKKKNAIRDKWQPANSCADSPS
jgi:hypothetical protein